MRNLLALAAALVIAFAAAGWYLNWYSIYTTPTTEGRHQVTIDFDGQKITQDLQQSGKHVATLIQNANKNQNSDQPPALPTLTNPSPQPSQPQPPHNETGLQQTQDGFFVLPGDFPGAP